MVGAMVFPRTGEHYLDHPSFRPIFEIAAERGVPVYVHPQLPPQAVRDSSLTGFGRRVDLMLSSGGWGWHAEAGLAALRLILAGTLDRHPELQLMLGHWGEMLVSFRDRADVLSDVHLALQRRVGDVIAENVLVTAGGIYSHRMLLDAIAAVGADRVLFAADDPYRRDAGDGAARAFLDAAPIGADDRATIASGNARRLRLVPRAEAQPGP
jgi:predicted TIM-barrel fold metal-dependent hydrolase